MGCGKSSVGRELSELLCCRFMDLDEVVEERAGRKIPEIFASEGEAAFRAMELEALKRVLDEYGPKDDSYVDQLMHAHARASYSEGTDVSSSSNLVLALGGGTVMTPECASLVHEHTFCIYLRASLETLVGHLAGEAEGRPMLQGTAPVSRASAQETMDPKQISMDSTGLQVLRSRITELMNLRSSTYESVAHLILDTDVKTLSEIALECMPVGK